MLGNQAGSLDLGGAGGADGLKGTQSITVSHRPSSKRTGGFPASGVPRVSIRLATLLCISYVMRYALTHLPHLHPMTTPFNQDVS